MKKLFYLVFFLMFLSGFAQTVTLQQAQTSDDPRIVATFIKANPDHPQTPELKRRLIAIVNSNKTPNQQAAVAKPKVAPLKSGTVSQGTISSAGSSASHKTKTTDLLNHLFNNDPNSKDAYLQITNKSKCNLVVKISGKKFYNLTIPANNQNFILVEKGTYTLTSSICDAKYSSVKDISKDLMITLSR